MRLQRERAGGELGDRIAAVRHGEAPQFAVHVVRHVALGQRFERVGRVAACKHFAEQHPDRMRRLDVGRDRQIEVAVGRDVTGIATDERWAPVHGPVEVTVHRRLLRDGDRVLPGQRNT